MGDTATTCRYVWTLKSIDIFIEKGAFVLLFLFLFHQLEDDLAQSLFIVDD